MKSLIVVLARKRVGEMRCENCHALLYRVLGKSVASASFNIEIKCKRCGHLNRGGAWENAAQKVVPKADLERQKEIM